MYAPHKVKYCDLAFFFLLRNLLKEQKTFNEQGSKGSAAKKRANTSLSGVGISNIMRKSIYIYLLTTPQTNHTYTF